LARTKEKSYSVRTVKSKEDRKRPTVFLRLKTDEAFKAHALFEPDPETEDNPGYFEYYDHYDNQGSAYVPCAGEKCPFCMANDSPATRALTAWYFPDGEKGEQIKVFTMNWGTINQADDEAQEEDGLLGKKIRIKRLDDRGGYRLRTLSDKPLTKAELKSIKKELKELFPNGLEGHVEKQLKVQMERLKALDALEDDEDDDDEDEDETPKARKGKAVVKEEDEDEDDEDEEDEEEEEDEDEDEEDSEDEDEDEQEEDEEDEDGEDEDEDENAVEGKFTILKVNESEETFDLEGEDGKVKMWLGEGVEVDYDVVKKGVVINASAQKDSEGDWIITELEVAKKTRKK
jgi:hypothetical protein